MLSLAPARSLVFRMWGPFYAEAAMSDARFLRVQGRRTTAGLWLQVGVGPLVLVCGLHKVTRKAHTISHTATEKGTPSQEPPERKVV